MLKNQIFPLLIVAFLPVNLWASDTLTIKLKLLNVNKVLTFNQSHVPGGSEEYRWEVLIDTDNNTNTGNSEGYELGCVLRNTKLPGSISYTGTIISGSELHTITYSGNTWSYGNELTVFFGDNDSSLHIKALTCYPEIAGITPGGRIMARTAYYSASGLMHDETTSCIVPGTVGDLPGDAGEDFIDIISVEINHIYTGIPSNEIKESSSLFYPNPSTGKLFVTAIGGITILSGSGEKLLCSDQGEIKLCGFSPGIYFIRDNETGRTQKLILQGL